VDRDGVLRLWDARSGASLAVGERASESITGVAFAPDDSRIWTKGISQSATSWENASGKLMAKPLERGAACKDSNDSDDLMGSIQKGEDGTVRVRNLEIARVPQDATKQSRAVISPDGRFLARARADGRVEVIDLRTRSLAGATEPCACGLNSISMSPDGTHLVTNGCDSYWRVWDWRKGALVASRWGSEAVLAFSPDGTSIAVGRGDGIEVWKFSVDELKSGGRDKEVGTIRSLAFSPNGKLVASGHSHGAIVWGAERGIVVGRSYRNKTAVTSVVFSSCGNYLAQGDEEGTVSVWACYATGPEPVRMAPKEANTMWLTQAAELPGPPEDRHREEVWESPVWTMTIGSVNRSGYCVRSLAFSPKSEMLLIGGPRDRVTAWDWRTGAKGVWFVGSPVAAVAFTDAELGEVVVAGDCGEWWAYKMLKPR